MELFNPHDNQWLLNKFKHYDVLRGLESAYYSPTYQMYVITRYKDVLDVLSDPMIFSSAHGNLIVEKRERFGKTPGASDDPTHALYKDIIKQGYAKSNIERIIGIYKEKIIEYLDRCGEIIDLSELAEETTSWAVAELVNLPHDKEHVKNLILDIQRRSEFSVKNNIDSTTLEEYTHLCNDYTKVKKPGHGPGLYAEYIKNIPANMQVLSLLVGPTLSGAHSLTGAVEFMILDMYRQGVIQLVRDDSNLIPYAVNESLRFNTTTGRFSRTVLKKITIHGVELKRGDRVAACLESANRDPDKFSDAELFDLKRDTVGHLGFGYGTHACISLAITKALMATFLETFLENVKDFKVLVQDDQLEYYITASGNNDMLVNLKLAK